ncbi:hypothetical protein [Galbibacter sp. PAP.153]|uniref:hypothetical protein n=1 Tax=Galbibacter sp. PAP.153 TaxID=3104623 RepID=UPI00300A842B
MKSFFRNALMILLPTTLIISCNDDDSNGNPDGSSPEAITPAEVQTSMEAEDVSGDIDNVVDFMVVADLGDTSAKSDALASKGWLPDCYTISTEATSDSFITTLDFGEGCEMPDGKMLGGMLTLSYLKETDSTSHTRTSEVTFENFTVDSVTVNGMKTYQHTFSQEENPTSSVVTDITLTWEDDTSMAVSSEKTREWVKGFDNGTWGDSAFLITGNASVTNREGVVFTSDISTPLRAELSCDHLVSGVIDFSKDDATAQLDYGDGTCDDKAMFTGTDGETVEITLEKK